ncbi:sphingosine kinase 2-like isoform X2 [Bolinopsis microptera]|uniref:sphingosine kinase 2-like isoform X2 n=1 Tax=Bolinopsis microptera TaxID=2820187 RepID=UPI00307AB1F1
MSEALLADEFVYTVNNVDTETFLILTSAGICIRDGKGAYSYRLKYIHLSDVIGAKVHYGAKDSVYLLVHYFPLIKNRFNGKIQRCKKQVILCANQHETASGNVSQCMNWRRAITQQIYGCDETASGTITSKKRTFLAFVNPKGGKGIAKKMWLNTVKPMLDVAGITSEVVYTEYSGHARDYVQECKELFKYSAIMTVSGDGIVFEVFNGLMKREDHAEAIKIPLAIIPGGSGNGLCAAILHQSTVPATLMDAVYVAIRGISTPLDMVRVEQGEKVMWSFQAICWGFMSSIDIESEMNRWMGEARFTVEAVKKLVSFPVKSGKVWFAPVGDEPESKSTVSSPRPVPRPKKIEKDSIMNKSSTSVISGNLDVSGDAIGEILDPNFDFTALNDVDSDSDGDSQDIDSKIPDRSRVVSESVTLQESSDTCQCKKCVPVPELDPVALQQITDSIENIGLNSDIPDSWKLLEGKFSSVNAFSRTHLTSSIQVTELDMPLDCGYLWFMWSDSNNEGYNRQDFYQLLVNNCTPECNETRTIHFEKVRAFRLEPELSESGAYVTIDGELVPYEPLHACIFKGIARVICLPLMD